MRLELEIALECLWYGLETLTRRDVALYFMGEHGSASERRLDYLLAQLRRQKLVAQHGRGQNARFSITEAGQQRRHVRCPAASWDRAWDGQWRAFLFDLPATRKADRTRLWRTLRAAKFGLLQRSVWVWPHEVEPLLRATIQARNIPECFCGLTVRDLFLCKDSELVDTSWDFAAISQGHDSYLQHAVATPGALNRATNLAALYRLARIERTAYQYAFALDPLLPRPLWPKGYQGEEVENRHRAFQARLTTRLAALASS